MMLEKLIVFVEEYSMEVALEILLPKMLGALDYQIITFSCKNELLKHLPERLKGYSTWLPKSWSLLVLVDRDDDDCHHLKQKLEEYAQSAGFITKTADSTRHNFNVTNRIVIEELEAWYFGDWNAVQTAYPKVPVTIPRKAPYRNSDAIKGGTWEALERIFQRVGYFSTGLRKAECARSIARHMDIHNNGSHSFSMFRGAVQAMLAPGT